MKESIWRIKKYGTFTIFFIILSIVLFILLIVPIFNFIFQENPLVVFETLFTKVVAGAIITSFYCSFLATLLAFGLGVPLGYLLARYRFPGKRVVDSIVDLPILIPHSVAGIMLLAVYGEEGFFSQFFGNFNISFTDTPWGVVIAMFFVSAPFLIKGARDAFANVNPNVEKAARTLGASRTRTFATITMPIASRGIFTGCILCWARGISEFGAVYILASTPLIGSTLVYQQFEGYGFAAVRPTAIALILVTLIIFIILKFVQGKERPITRVT
ncbi:MAG: ABC transporter permease [Candidatus Helarchaeota archaeon]|nr:ABC transporter permease [Candidatus Helarchaeota archaeon]